MRGLVVCVLVQMCRAVFGSYAEEMASATQRCCNQGTAYGRLHTAEDCSSSSPPAVPAQFGSLCILAMDDCCKQYFQKKKDCDAGVDVASTTQQCAGTANSAQMCCNECKRGTEMASRGAGACEARPAGSAAEELLAGDAFRQCCVRAAEHIEPTHQEPLMPATTSSPSRSGADMSSLCEEYAPNELCAHHCIPVPGYYKCQCNPGYMLMADGRNCKAVEKNRCKPRNPCHHRCNDNGGAEIKCSCRRGYELMADGKSCQDIDECSLSPPVCLSGTQCFNVHGSFKCIPSRNHGTTTGTCPAGFSRNSANHACDDINECALPNPPCPSYLCENTIGGYKCGGVSGDPSNLPSRSRPPVEDRCPAGFRAGRDEECEDIDECVTHSDDCNQLSQFCINTRGSFYCQDRSSKYCPPGFKINTTTNKCEDINECEDDPDTCGNLVCVNLLGLYDCRATPVNNCPDGMRLRKDTAICEDIDECLEGTHLCDQHQNCLNTNGSHECHCKLGFEIDGTTGACVDVNECATERHNCLPRSQRCDNTVGSFLCVRIASCGTGYTLQHTTGMCEDINECALGIDNCGHSGTQVKCVNIPGSFRCEIIRPSTTSTTPEYEYYYDEEEENETQSQPDPPARPDRPSTTTPRPEPKPITTPSTPPTQPTTPQEIPENRRPEDNNVYFNHADTPRNDPRNAAPTPSTYYETSQEPERRAESEPPRVPEEPERPRELQPREPDRPIEPERPREPEQPRQQQPQEPEQPRETERPTPSYYQPSEPPRQPESPAIEPPTPQTSLHRPTEPQTPEISRSPENTEQPENSSPRFVHVDQNNQATATVDGERRQDGSVFVDTKNVPNNEWTRIRERPVDCQIGFEMDSYGACFDIDECSVGRHSCSQTETCRNTMGAYVCDCRTGYRRELATGECTLIPTTPPPTTTEATTEFDPYRKYWGTYNTRRTTKRPTRPRNLCDVGYHHNSTTDKCEDVNECLNGQANCADVELCINTEGGYRCECPPHWVLDATRHRCVPERSSQLIPPGYSNEPDYPQVDQVISHEHSPTKFVEPTVTGQGMTCQWGYRLGRDNICEDINECMTGEARCGPEQLCTNFPSGYTCSCPRGHRLVGDHQCEDVDECQSAGSQSICSDHADCVNTVGSYQCKCHKGFRAAPANDKVCVDVDECSESPSGSLCEQRCNNVWGGYRCSCHRGYRLNPDNRTCSDVDECTEFRSKLLCFGRCLNEPGSYRCTCPPGYRLSEDKRSCIDIDECETGENPCAVGMYGGVSNVCLNTRGSYRCQKITCPPGYRLESKNRCTKIEKVCHPSDWECAHQPSKYSYHFITFVSKLYIPDSKVNLFVMRGPSWPNAKERFELTLRDVNAPPTVREKADIKAFLLTQTGNQASVSLVRSLEGPQTIELELSMELYSGETFGGIAVAKLYIHVSEYEF